MQGFGFRVRVCGLYEGFRALGWLLFLQKGVGVPQPLT